MTRPVFRRIDPSAVNAIQLAPHDTRFLPVLAHLAALLLAARARGDDPWHFAPTLAELAPLGLTPPDCLALIAQGIFATEPSPTGRGQGEGGSRPVKGKKQGSGKGQTKGPGVQGSGEGGRKSRKGHKSSGAVARTNPPRLGARTRLLLTDAGLAFITKHAQSSRRAEPSPSAPAGGQPGQGDGKVEPSRFGRGQGEGASPTGRSSTPQSAPSVSLSPPPLVSLSPLVPHYDIDLRELSVAGVVILRLPVQARNLAAVLTALQQGGWKPRVAKPLNGRPGGNDHHHLAIVAYKLNGRQSLVEFHADDGAVRWIWRGRSPQY